MARHKLITVSWCPRKQDLQELHNQKVLLCAYARAHACVYVCANVLLGSPGGILWCLLSRPLPVSSLHNLDALAQLCACVRVFADKIDMFHSMMHACSDFYHDPVLACRWTQPQFTRRFMAFQWANTTACTASLSCEPCVKKETSRQLVDHWRWKWRGNFPGFCPTA